MSKVLTIRMHPGKLAKLHKRAAALGQDRSSYVRGLIEQDLNLPEPQRRKFASSDLLGAYRTGVGRCDNQTVRRLFRKRLLQKYKKNR